MLSEDFIKSNDIGIVGEHLLADILRQPPYSLKIYEAPDRYFPDFDLKILDNGKTIEVKYSTQAHQTGNICLELNTLGYSKADILAIAYGKPIIAFYLVPLQAAKELAEQWPMKKWIGTPKEECALVPRRMFFEKLKPAIITL